MNARVTFFLSSCYTFFRSPLYLIARCYLFCSLSICETRTKLFRIKNDVFATNKTTEKRHRFFYSTIPNECRNSTELSSALFCGYLTCDSSSLRSLRTKRCERARTLKETKTKRKGKNKPKNFTFGVKTVTETVCTDESYRIASHR